MEVDETVMWTCRALRGDRTGFIVANEREAAKKHRRVGIYPADVRPSQPTISLPAKNWLISCAAVSAASEPCTEFSPIDFA